MLNMKIHKKNLRKDIRRIHRRLDEVKTIVDALPDELPEGISIYVGNYAAHIDIPFDWDKYREVRRCLRGWLVQGVYNNDEDGTKFYTLAPPDSGPFCYTNLFITLKSSMSGSKCHTEVIGKREVDIVEVICDA